MTKTELISALHPFNDDAIVVLRLGEGWSNIHTVECAGCVIEIQADEDAAIFTSE